MTTKRFGLDKFGGAEGGNLSDDAFKFSTRDRDVIDAVLAAFEGHDHSGGDRLTDPDAAPTLATLTTGGALAGGRTYYYRVSLIDQYGLETAASPEAAIATPGPVAAPGAPTLASQATGGSLSTGVYQYALTAVAGAYETQLGSVAVLTLMADRDSIMLTMPALPAGADSFGVWRQGPNDAGFTKIGTTTAVSILDDGSVPSNPNPCNPDNLPPQENRTNATNIVTVTAPTLPAGTKKWRIYRTTSSGAYGGDSLVAEVSELDAGGALVTEYIDEGATLLPGSPLDVSTTLTPTAQVVAGTGGSDVILLEAPDTSVWRITATREGAVQTRPTDVPAGYAPSGFIVFDANGATWRVTVGNDGGLVTTQAAPVAGDVTYPQGLEPKLPTVDGAVSWVLTVSTTGVIETLGTDDSTVVEGVNVRRIIAGVSEPTGMKEGDVFFQVAP